METIRAVVFDLYGTLIRIHTDEENLNRVWKPMTFYYGYNGAKYSSPDQLRRAYRSEVRRHQRAADAHFGPGCGEVALEQVLEALFRKKGAPWVTGEMVRGAGMLLPRHNSAYLGRAAPRAAAGALERLPIARVDNLAHALDSAEEAGLTLYVAGCGGAATVNAFEEPLRLPAVLVLGNEDKGLRPGVAKRCAQMLHIPLARSFDSLNVAQAGAILLGLAARQRRA